MEFIIENWSVMIALAALSIFIGGAAFMFFKLPSNKQLDKVKEWLLYAVVIAEKELGKNTGQIKLRFVYDMFLVKFKWTSRLTSFETFSLLVDQSLQEMRIMLESNEVVKELVNVNK